jgi:beta-aspartyl-peptidase (threonine type)
VNELPQQKSPVRVALRLAAVLLVIALAVWPWVRPRLDEPAVAEEAIQAVLDAQVESWNRGDLRGFMAGYWESPDFRFFSGDAVIRGWLPAFERFQKRYQGEGRAMGTLSFSDLEVELLDDKSALVRGRWTVVTGQQTLGGLFTLLFKKLPEGWRIVHDHTSSAS